MHSHFAAGLEQWLQNSIAWLLALETAKRVETETAKQVKTKDIVDFIMTGSFELFSVKRGQTWKDLKTESSVVAVAATVCREINRVIPLALFCFPSSWNVASELKNHRLLYITSAVKRLLLILRSGHSAKHNTRCESVNFFALLWLRWSGEGAHYHMKYYSHTYSYPSTMTLWGVWTYSHVEHWREITLGSECAIVVVPDLRVDGATMSIAMHRLQNTQYYLGTTKLSVHSRCVSQSTERVELRRERMKFSHPSQMR